MLTYGKPIDIFATGLILAELYSLRPLLPGISEMDQLNKLMKLLGPPTERTWEEGVTKMKRMNFRLPDDESVQCDEKLVSAIQATMPKGTPPTVASLIRQLIEWNPTSRPNAEEALQHEYFQSSNDNQSTVHKSKHVYSGREFQTSAVPLKMFGQRNREKDHDERATNHTYQPNTYHNMHKVEEIVAEQSKPSSQQAACLSKARLPLNLPKMKTQPPEPENNEFSDYLSAFTNHPSHSLKGNTIRPMFPEKMMPMVRNYESEQNPNLLEQSTPLERRSQIARVVPASRNSSGNRYHMKGRSTAKKTRKTKPHGSSRYGGHRGRREVSISMSTLTESSTNMWGGMERGEPPAPACVSGDGDRKAEDNLIIPDPFQCLE